MSVRLGRRLESWEVVKEDEFGQRRKKNGRERSDETRRTLICSWRKPRSIGNVHSSRSSDRPRIEVLNVVLSLMMNVCMNKSKGRSRSDEIDERKQERRVTH